MIFEQKFMRQALDLARKGEGRTAPNPPVGAVVVKDGKVVGRGYHPRAGMRHAERYALEEAGEKARGADLYVTLEPCSHHGRTGPCTKAILAAGITRVFAGVRDPNPRVDGKGLAELEAAGVKTACGFLEDECRRLISPFSKYVRTGLPEVVLKAALTLDGKIATAGGDSQWISCSESRQQVHRLRDRVDAVMVGNGTVIRDNPRLTTRLDEGGRDAVRIVVDPFLHISEHARILHLDSLAPTILVISADLPSKKTLRFNRPNVQLLPIPMLDCHIDLTALMKTLGKMAIHSILLEGGCRLNSEMLRWQLIDRLMIFIAPRLVGGDGISLFAGKGVSSMADAIQLQDVRFSFHGQDILVEGEVPYVHGSD